MEVNEKSTKFHCICQDTCSIVVFEKDPINNGNVEISVFHNAGRTNNMSIKDKIRWIWQIIRHGSVWNDYTILGSRAASDLKEWL